LLISKKKQENLSMNSNSIVNPTNLLYEIFNKKFLLSFTYPNQIPQVFKKHIGYSAKYQSLTISIFDYEDNVKTIAIRKAKDQNNAPIKWKSYGKKAFVAHRIFDEYIFLGVGMAELILFEIMLISYILIQADGMYRHITQEILAKCNGKSIIILKENDDSFEKLIVKLQSVFINSNIIIIDFEQVLLKKLTKGYDFRDFCNEINAINKVEQMLKNEIIKQIRKRK